MSNISRKWDDRPRYPFLIPLDACAAAHSHGDRPRPRQLSLRGQSAATVPSETVEAATSTSANGLSRGSLERTCTSPSSHTLRRYVQHEFALLPTIWKNSSRSARERLDGRRSRRAHERHLFPNFSVPWPLRTRPPDARFAPLCAAGTGDLQLDELSNPQRADAHGIARTIFLSRSALEAPRDDVEARQAHLFDACRFRAYRAYRAYQASARAGFFGSNAQGILDIR